MSDTERIEETVKALLAKVTMTQTELLERLDQLADRLDGIDLIAAADLRSLIAEAKPAELRRLEEENAGLRLRLLSAAGDDLCRLSQEEIKAYTSGKVQIPPKEEFLSSCERFHAQIASEAGVLEGCLTLAQLIAENAKLEAENEYLRKRSKFQVDRRST
jgi:hypothetical protein